VKPPPYLEARVSILKATPPPAPLVQALLRDADIHGTPDPLTLLGVSTCSVWRLTVREQTYVVRYRLDGDSQLAHKEAYLSALLHRHAVPAPVVLAVEASASGVATLSTWRPGIPLDQAMERLAPADLCSAWRSTGAALRRAHAIVLPAAGEIVRDRVEPFNGGWEHWVLADLADDLSWLQAALDAPRVNLQRLERVVAAALNALRRAPVRLIHNDALPQNILVAQEPGGWSCTGWLDWEFARAADPRWDVGTLDFRPAGLVPAAFYEGYGAWPSEPQASIYDLLMATWRTRVELEHGGHWSWPPQQSRIDYLHSLPDQIDRLAELLYVRP
jgi:aminoglycoside phosphotransferase (APT) family kinase protein